VSHTKLILGSVILFALGVGLGVGGAFLLPEPPPPPVAQSEESVTTPPVAKSMVAEEPNVERAAVTTVRPPVPEAEVVADEPTSPPAPPPAPIIAAAAGDEQPAGASISTVAEGDLILPEAHENGQSEETLPYEEVTAETVFEGPPEGTEGTQTASLNDKIGELVDIENIPEPKIPLWRTNAVILSEIPEGPQVAIVIDDAGIDRRRTKQVIGLPGPLTIAFLTYARRLEEQVKAASEAGHEIMTHVPMQPHNPDANPGENALKTDLEPDAVKSRLEWALSRIPNHVGINNHMGSRFTSHDKGMKVVMEELRRRGLLFLDSRTTQKTVGAKLASLYHVPHAVRNVFLDHDPKLEVIKKQLTTLERIARKRGYAVAIGHPRDATIEALAQWLPILAEKGLVLVPISAIIARRNGIPQDQIKISVN